MSQAAIQPIGAERRFFDLYAKVVGGDSWANVQQYLRNRAPKPSSVEGWIAAAEAVRSQAEQPAPAVDDLDPCACPDCGSPFDGPLCEACEERRAGLADLFTLPTRAPSAKTALITCRTCLPARTVPVRLRGPAGLLCGICRGSLAQTLGRVLAEHDAATQQLLAANTAFEQTLEAASAEDQQRYQFVVDERLRAVDDAVLLDKFDRRYQIAIDQQTTFSTLLRAERVLWGISEAVRLRLEWCARALNEIEAAKGGT